MHGGEAQVGKEGGGGKEEQVLGEGQMGLAWNASNVMAGMRAWLRLECGLIVFLCCFFLSNKRGITLRVTTTTCPPTYPYLPTWLFTYLPTNPPTCFSTNPPTHLPIYLPVHQPTYIHTY